MLALFLMLEAAKRGGDRQHLHEVIRTASMEAAKRIKHEGHDNDLLDRLRKTPEFAAVPIDDLMDPKRFIGLAPAQVDSFITDQITPVRDRYAEKINEKADLRV